MMSRPIVRHGLNSPGVLSRVVLYSLMILALSACYFDVVVPEDVTEVEELSFSDDIVPIFKTSCVSCHDGQVTVPDLTEQNAYESLTAGNYISKSIPESSLIVAKIRSDHPYAGALTETDIDKIIKWIEEGALDN